MGKPTRYGSRQQIKRRINMMHRNIDNAEEHLRVIYDMVKEQKVPDEELFAMVFRSLELGREVIYKFREQLIG